MASLMSPWRTFSNFTTRNRSPADAELTSNTQVLARLVMSAGLLWLVSILFTESLFMSK